MSKKNKELENHFVKTSKQSVIVFISKFLGYLLGFSINFVLAKFYGAKILGQYTLIDTYLNIIIIFTIFGLDNGLIKYISRYNSDNDDKSLEMVIRIAFKYALLFSFLGSVGTYISKKYIGEIFNDELLSISLVIGAWIIIPKTLNRLFGGVYRGLKRIKNYILLNEIYRRLIMFLMLLIFTILKIPKLNNVIIALLFSSLSTTLFLYFNATSLKIDLKEIFINIFRKQTTNLSVRKSLLNYSSTMILISFMNILLSRTDKIMIGIFSNSSSVGIYNIAAKVGGVTSFLLASSSIAFAPIISELYSQNKINFLEKLYSTITKWISTLTVPIIVTILVFPENLLSFFGNEYITGKYVLILIALGHMANSIVGSNGYILNMSGYERLILFNNFGMAIINIILNILLIPRLNILGAAIATAISISITNIIKIFQVKKYLNIFPYNRKFVIIMINFIFNYLIAYIISTYSQNLITIFIVTLINILVSIILLYINKDELDEVLFKRIKIKAKNLIE